MKIHPPTGPIRSVREFLLHLLTITCGVLIALSFDGIVVRQHHRHLVREAIANLASEIGENRNVLESGIKRMDKTQEQLQAILTAVHKLQANRNASPGDLALDVSISTLRSTAWSTAAATGALSYMGQEAVGNYTTIYELQQQFISVQQRALDAMLELESYGTLLQGSLTQVSNAQGVEAERAVGRALATTRMAEDIGKALSANYSKFLAGK